MKSMVPKYVDIAVDIATRIKRRELKEGQKLGGRSLASSGYSVSSETIRKSFNMLQEYQVLTVKEKSGAIILSRQNAIFFLENFKSYQKLDNDIQQLKNLRSEAQEINLKIKNTISQLEQHTKTFHPSLPIEYITIQLHINYYCVGKTVEEMDFYKKTEATLFGIVSKDKVISSVPLDYILQENDVLYFSGNHLVGDNIINYIKKM